MKLLLLIFFLNILTISINAQQNNSIVIGKIDSLQSQILKEQRKIWVHIPASAQDADAKKKYPVVYLMDGDKNFSGVAGMIDFLSTVNGNNYWPEMIIVGIINTDRVRDLTPTHVPVGGWIDSSASRSSGGGEAFMAFIEKELIPHIDSLYPTTSYRMLIGHSLGGLTVINTLLYHKNMFKSYVAIDPSMWWDKQKLLQQAAQALKTNSYTGTSLFLAMAHTQESEMDTTMLQKDTTEGTIHPRSILQLSRYIMNNRQNGLQASYKYYDDDTHGSVPLIATYDALHFIFKDYQLIFKNHYFDDSTFKPAAFLTAHFENISVKYGITSKDGHILLPPENLVNNLGYFLLHEKKQFKKAEEIFKLNIKNYPEGFRAYDYLGDLYAVKGDNANAVTNYKKSLLLKETTETRKKLDKLK